MTVNDVFRERLLAAVKDSGLSMDKIGYLSGYSPNYILRLKNGHMSNPTISLVWAVANALDVSPYWLLGED